MRFVAWVLALGLVLIGHDADAYARVAHRGAFGALLTDLGTAARRHDMTAIRRLTSKEFTVGEELGRDDSLTVLARDAAMRGWLAAIANHGACYRTGHAQVQCELPDPGVNLDHTKLGRSSIAIFERTRRGWKLSALYA